jgi:hypothetical protein
MKRIRHGSVEHLHTKQEREEHAESVERS